VAGLLVDLDEKTARALRVGARFPADGHAQAEIVALGDPQADARVIRVSRGEVELEAAGRWQREASILIDCDVSVPLQCRVGGLPVQADGSVIDVPGTNRALLLRVQELVPESPPTRVTVRIRFLAPAEAIDLIKVGDRDESAPAVDGRAATVTAVDRREIVQGTTMVAPLFENIAPPSAISVSERVAAIEAVVQLGADRSSDGLRYRLQPLGVGRSIPFVTRRYAIRGLVRSVGPIDASPADRR